MKISKIKVSAACSTNKLQYYIHKHIISTIQALSPSNNWLKSTPKMKKKSLIEWHRGLWTMLISSLWWQYVAANNYGKNEKQISFKKQNDHKTMKSIPINGYKSRERNRFRIAAKWKRIIYLTFAFNFVTWFVQTNGICICYTGYTGYTLQLQYASIYIHTLEYNVYLYSNTASTYYMRSTIGILLTGMNLLTNRFSNTFYGDGMASVHILFDFNANFTHPTS